MRLIAAWILWRERNVIREAVRAHIAAGADVAPAT
jgi:hypothetical protein